MKTRLVFALLASAAAACAQGPSVVISAPVFDGSGLNDATSGGTFISAPSNHIYVLCIASTGTPDQITLVKDGVSAGAPTGITGANQAIGDGVQVKWTATTGHTAGNCWTITATANGSLVTSNFIQPQVGARFRNAQAVLRDLPLSIADYGAQPGHDSTASIQFLLNMAIVSGQSMRIMIPNTFGSCYTISSTLNYTAPSYLQSLEIEGAVLNVGNQGACIKWAGAAGGTMMHVTGGLLDHLHNFALDGSGTAAVDLWIDSYANDPSFPTAIGKANDAYHDLVIAQYTETGIQVGHEPCPGSNRLDSLTFRNIQISSAYNYPSNPAPATTTGLKWMCGGNTEEFTMYDSTILNNGTALKVNNANSVVLVHPYFFYSTAQDIYQNAGRFSEVGWHSEGSTRHINNAGGGTGTVMNSVELSAGTFGGNGDLYPMDGILVSNNGPTMLRGNSFSAPGGVTVTTCTNANPMVCTFPSTSGLGNWTSGDIGYIQFLGSAIASAKPSYSGLGYVVGDVVNVDIGTGGQLRVDSVNGSGSVTGFSVVAAGTGYPAGAVITTTGGTGSGVTVILTTTIAGSWGALVSAANSYGNIAATATGAHTASFASIDSSGFGAFSGAGSVTSSIVAKVAIHNPGIPNPQMASVHSYGNWYGNADASYNGSPFWWGHSVYNPPISGPADLSQGSLLNALRAPRSNALAFISSGDNGGPVFNTANLPEQSPQTTFTQTAFPTNITPGDTCQAYMEGRSLISTSTGDASGTPYIFHCANSIWLRGDLSKVAPVANSTWTSDATPNLFTPTSTAGGGPAVNIGRPPGSGNGPCNLFNIQGTSNNILCINPNGDMFLNSFVAGGSLNVGGGTPITFSSLGGTGTHTVYVDNAGLLHSGGGGLNTASHTTGVTVSTTCTSTAVAMLGDTPTITCTSTVTDPGHVHAQN